MISATGLNPHGHAATSEPDRLSGCAHAQPITCLGRFLHLTGRGTSLTSSQRRKRLHVLR